MHRTTAPDFCWLGGAATLMPTNDPLAFILEPH